MAQREQRYFMPDGWKTKSDIARDIVEAYQQWEGRTPTQAEIDKLVNQNIQQYESGGMWGSNPEPVYNDNGELVAPQGAVPVSSIQGGQGTDTLAGAGGTLITYKLRGSRTKPVSPQLTDAVSRVIEQTYGPGYTAVLRSAAGHSITGTQRHTPGRADQPGVAADFQIFAPDGHQLAGAELDPLLKNWVGIEGSMGANRYPGENGRNFTHMDLIGGIQPYSVPLGKGEDVFWAYDGLDPKSTFSKDAQKRMVASGEIQPVVAPQNAQSAIASLIAPSGGTEVPDQPTPAMGMGYAWNPSPSDMLAAPAPAMPPVQTAAVRPPPEPLPSWTDGSFPPVAGNAGQEQMVGGITPPMPNLRDQGALDQQRADQLDELMFGAGPHRGDFARGRPEGRFLPGAGGAPDASAVPIPNINPLAPAVGGPNDRRPQVPIPPSRASGLPDPRMRPDINDPSISFNAPPYAGGGPTAGPVAPSLQSMVAGREEFPGALPAAPRAGDLSAAMGDAPQPSVRVPERNDLTPELMSRLLEQQGIGPFPARPETPGALPAAANPYDDWTRQFDIPGALTRADMFNAPVPAPAAPLPTTPPIGNLNYSGAMPSVLQPQTQGAAASPGMGLGPYGMTPSPSPLPSFDFANPDPMPSRVGDLSAAMGGPPAPYVPDFNFSPTPSPLGPTGNVAMTGEGAPSAPNWQSPPGVSGMTYTPPMPPAPPAISQGMRDQFDIAFSPGGPGMIADLPGSFAARNAPPTMNAQDGINSIFGAPLAQAQPPNLAIPFAEVPGFDFSGRFAGAPPADASAVAGRPLPSPPAAPLMPGGDPWRNVYSTIRSVDDYYKNDLGFVRPGTEWANYEGMPTMADVGGAPPTAAPAQSPRVVGSPADAVHWNTAPPSDMGLGPVSPLMQGASAFYRPDAPDPTFAGGSVVRPPTPPPGATADVYSRYTEEPGGTPAASPDPIELAIAPPSQTPRNIGAGAERERKGLAANILGAIFGGGGGGGLFGGSGGTAFTPFSGGPMMNTGFGGMIRSSGTAPNASGGQTNFQHGTAFNGSSPATTFTTNDGRTYTYTSDPVTGSPIGGFV